MWARRSAAASAAILPRLRISVKTSIPFTVTRVDPVVRRWSGIRKIFSRVEVTFDPKDVPEDIRYKLKPGMEGVAKVDAGNDHCYFWIWTHRRWEWVRMKLWI